MKRYNLVSLVLLIWLGVMSGFGVQSVGRGTLSYAEFAAIFLTTLLCIILLRRQMKKGRRR